MFVHIGLSKCWFFGYLGRNYKLAQKKQISFHREDWFYVPQVSINGLGLPLGPRQTSDFDEQYFDKKIKQYCNKKTFFRQYFISMWLENLNSWVFQLILKSNSSIVSKKYCFCHIALLQYCLSKSLVWRGPKGVKYKQISNVQAVFGSPIILTISTQIKWMSTLAQCSYETKW